jgi:hypothetical protein
MSDLRMAQFVALKTAEKIEHYNGSIARETTGLKSWEVSLKASFVNKNIRKLDYCPQLKPFYNAVVGALVADKIPAPKPTEAEKKALKAEKAKAKKEAKAKEAADKLALEQKEEVPATETPKEEVPATETEKVEETPNSDPKTAAEYLASIGVSAKVCELFSDISYEVYCKMSEAKVLSMKGIGAAAYQEITLSQKKAAEKAAAFAAEKAVNEARINAAKEADAAILAEKAAALEAASKEEVATEEATEETTEE